MADRSRLDILQITRPQLGWTDSQTDREGGREGVVMYICQSDHWEHSDHSTDINLPSKTHWALISPLYVGAGGDLFRGN